MIISVPWLQPSLLTIWVCSTDHEVPNKLFPLLFARRNGFQGQQGAVLCLTNGAAIVTLPGPSCGTGKAAGCSPFPCNTRGSPGLLFGPGEPSLNGQGFPVSLLGKETRILQPNGFLATSAAWGCPGRPAFGSGSPPALPSRLPVQRENILFPWRRWLSPTLKTQGTTPAPSATAGLLRSPPAPRGVVRRQRAGPGVAPAQSRGSSPSHPLSALCKGRSCRQLPSRLGNRIHCPPRADRSALASEPPARPAADRLCQAGTRQRRLGPSRASAPARLPSAAVRARRGGPTAGRPRAGSAPAVRGRRGGGRWRRRAGAAPRCRCWRPAGGGSRCGWGPARSCSRWVRGGEGGEGKTVAEPRAGRDTSLLSAGPRGGLQEAGWQPRRVRPEVSVAVGPGPGPPACGRRRGPARGRSPRRAWRCRSRPRPRCPGPGGVRGGRWCCEGPGHTLNSVPVGSCRCPCATFFSLLGQTAGPHVAATRHQRAHLNQAPDQTRSCPLLPGVWPSAFMVF